MPPAWRAHATHDREYYFASCAREPPVGRPPGFPNFNSLRLRTGVSAMSVVVRDPRSPLTGRSPAALTTTTCSASSATHARP
ncbi:hypothetical protein [Streptomyces sp. URMC 126]|uniref:hypothetical protein n=1 Tax=Streptomyces sp. URMC 126 TaxID=3423401 RepID=UPI003F532913